MRTISKRWLVLLALVLVVVGGAGVRASHAASASSPSDVLIFVAHLDSSQPVAGSASAATGTATMQIDTLNKTMTTDVQWSGLTGPADRSHVHSGLAGSPTDHVFAHELIDRDLQYSQANVILPSLVDCPGADPAVDPPACAPATGSIHDVLDISNGYDNCATFQCIVDHAVPDGFYIDIHTADYDGGEIRGQFVLVPQILLFSTASSSKWKTGTTVPIKFALTDTNGVRILDAQAAAMLSPTCTVKFSASGVQTVAATCMKYDTANHQFIYNWKLGKTPGGETFTITITHPPGNATTTQSTPITISSK